MWKWPFVKVKKLPLPWILTNFHKTQFSVSTNFQVTSGNNCFYFLLNPLTVPLSQNRIKNLMDNSWCFVCFVRTHCSNRFCDSSGLRRGFALTDFQSGLFEKTLKMLVLFTFLHLATFGLLNSGHVISIFRL